MVEHKKKRQDYNSVRLFLNKTTIKNIDVKRKLRKNK